MPKAVAQKASQTASDNGFLLELFKDAPWYAYIVYTLPGFALFALKSYLNYLKERRNSQIAHRKNIMNYKLSMAKANKRVDSLSPEVQDVK
jgi:hypothetical protein